MTTSGQTAQQQRREIASRLLAAVRRMPFGWEAGLLVLAIILLIGGQAYTGGLLLSGYNLETTATNSAVVACLALAVAPVIIAGDIDISIAATLSLSGVFMARIWEAGVNIWLAVILGLVLGALLGLVNGIAVVLFDLPALAVTLGTLGAYSGASLLVLQGKAVSNFPSSLLTLGTSNLPGTPIPVAMAIAIGVAVILGLLVHGTRFGKSLFAIGGNRKAALFSGIAVNRTRIIAFVLAGLISALAAALYLADYNTAIATMASDQLLPAITAVILGGVSAYGGTGTIPGVALAIALLALLQESLGLHGLSGEGQTIAVGVLLVIVMGARAGIGTLRQLRHRIAARAGVEEDGMPVRA